MKTAPLTRRSILGGFLVAGTALAFPCAPAQAKSPLGVASPTGLEAQLAALEKPIYLFESVVPSTVSTGDGTPLAISGDHGIIGKKSLRWDYRAGSKLNVDTDLHIGTAAPGQVDYFAVWLYNETAIDDHLTLEVGRGGSTQATQKVNLDFTGWRTLWLRYNQDFEGAPGADANRITLVAPNAAGSIWIDQLVTNSSVRSDRPTPDFQVPTIWPEITESSNFHWMGSLTYWNLQHNPGFDSSGVTTSETADAKTVYERLIGRQRAKKPTTAAALTTLESQFEQYGIPQLADPQATGEDLRPAAVGSWIYDQQLEIFPAEFRESIVEISDGQKLRTVWDKIGLLTAQTWDTANTAGDTAAVDRAGQLVLRLMVHMLDQGWAAGSGQATNHHLGYTYRNWAKSILMLEPLLRERGLWDQCSAAIEWSAGTGRLTYDFSQPYHRSGLIDVLNTLLEGLLTTCFIPENWDDRVGRLRSFRSWIDHAYSYTPGLDGGFKQDGTMYHHNGPYALYGRDAMSGSVPVVADVIGTTFALGAPAQKVLTEALFTQVLISNTLFYPVSQTGRQQTGLWDMKSLVNLFGLLGKTPLDGSAGYDEKFASMYRRLLQKDGAYSSQLKLEKEFADAGIGVAPAPQGAFSLPQGSTALLRQDEWQVTARTHNRYIWTTEIYDQVNLFGRYQTYGQISVIADVDGDNWATLTENGVVLPGYDWNYIPGATTKVLPFELLKTDLLGGYEWNLLSESAFGGPALMEGHASAFGMELKEHPLYDETHTARISALMVGDRVIALGSGVRNEDAAHPTRTTLFQVCPEVMTAPSEVQSGENWVVDPTNNGYVVLAGPAPTHRTAAQTTPDYTGNKQGTRVVSLGYLDHGTAPSDSGYAYVLLVQGGSERTAALASQASSSNAPVKIVQRDRTAHVVTDVASGITAHTVFEADKPLTSTSVVRSTSRQAMVLSRAEEGGERTVFSVTDPDLHLYKGRDEDQYDGDTYVGLASVYTRPWQFNDSEPTETTVVLAGRWTLNDAQGKGKPKVKGLSSGDTAVTVTTQHGVSVEFTLEQKRPPRGKE